MIITTYDNKENLASKMLLSKALAQSTERMRSFFINKNLSIDYRLKMRIRKKGIFEKVILVFGREQE